MLSERIQRRIDSLPIETDGAVSKLDWAIVCDRARAVRGLDPGNGDAVAYMEAAERELVGVSGPSPRVDGLMRNPLEAGVVVRGSPPKCPRILSIFL